MGSRLDLNEYLGKEIPCSCGRTHSANVRLVDIDRDATKRLPDHIRNFGYENVYLVADKNTWEAAGKAAETGLKEAGLPCKSLVLDYDELVPDEPVIGEILVGYPKEADLILAVGSGTINDLCKFISFQVGVD